MLTTARLKMIFAVMAIVAMLFPYYQFGAHPDQIGWFIDFLIGNIIFALVIAYGGWYSLLFGTMVAFQRILEIIAVHIWGHILQVLPADYLMIY